MVQVQIYANLQTYLVKILTVDVILVTIEGIPGYCLNIGSINDYLIQIRSMQL